MILKQLQNRRRIVCHELCHLSRNGWRDAKPCDYLPLEAELRALDAEWHKRKHS